MTSPVCPICHEPTRPAKENPVFPFCTARCKLLDLGSWLDGRYVVASDSPFDERGEASDLDSVDDN